MSITFRFAHATFFSAVLLACILVPRLSHAATLSGNTAFDTIFRSTGNSYLDVTAAGGDNTTNDTSLGLNSGQALYLGSQSPFNEIYFDIGTWGTGNGSVKIEYASAPILGGALFSSVNNVQDPSNGFKTVSADGITSLKFDLPSSWSKQTVNGVSAYWVKLTAASSYTVAPVASQIKTYAYNVKVLTQLASGAALDSPTVIATNCPLNVGGSATAVHLWSAGNGINYLAVPTPAVQCTLTLSDPNQGIVDETLSLTNVNTSLQDKTSSPIIFEPTLKVSVQNDLGQPVVDATVLSASINTPATTAPITNLGNGDYVAYYRPSAGTRVITVSRTGYVTVDSANGNTSLGNATITTSGQTHLSLSGGTPCTGAVSGTTAICSQLARDFIMKMIGANGPASNVAVSIYSDASYITLANDLSQNNGIGSGTDATGTVSGFYKAALAGGTYYYKLTANGYGTTTGQFTVVDGVQNTITVNLASAPNPPAPPQDQNVSAGMSFVSVSPNTVSANGNQASTITVTVNNAAGTALSGKTVTLASSLNGSSVTPASATTDSSGHAIFTITSPIVGSATLSATAAGTALSAHPIVQFVAGSVVCGQNVAVGSLIKLPDDGNPNTQEDTAVYYVSSDCKRHAFPNSKVYFSWYGDFSGVSVVSLQSMAAFTLGKNVTYRPGVKLVKFTTLNKVYAVSAHGVLRWVTSESTASALYGSTWNTKVDDIADTFYTDYQFGMDIILAQDFVIANEQNAAPSINDNF